MIFLHLDVMTDSNEDLTLPPAVAFVTTLGPNFMFGSK